MIANELEARDEILGMLNAGWNVATFDGFPRPALRFDGITYSEQPSLTDPYAFVTLKFTDSDQASIADEGNRRFTQYGILTVQNFGPVTGGRGLEIALQMAIIAKRLFEGKSSTNGVWFRRVRSTHVGAAGGWYQINTTIIFEYDEVR